MASSNNTSESLEKIPQMCSGVGLNLCHENANELWEQRPPLDFLQVHPEHLIQEPGGPYHQKLIDLISHYQVTFHGFGLSLGSVAPLDKSYLELVKELLANHPKAFFSDHLSWSSLSHHHFHDLLPIIFTEESLEYLVERVLLVQETIGAPLHLENISNYMRFKNSTIDEISFLNQLTERTGAFVLLDINNLWANSKNFSEDPAASLLRVRANSVRSYHLAGCSREKHKAGDVWIDYHAEAVHPEVWDLYNLAVQTFGPWPTLLEWENDVPPLKITLKEVEKVSSNLQKFLN